MTYMFEYDYDDDLDELRYEAQARRRYNNQLSRHLSCQDPDHPGCEACECDEDDAE